MDKDKIIITGRHMEITDAIKEHARQKIEKLSRFFDRIHGVNLTMNVEGTRHCAEAIINIPGNDIVVREESESMYNTLDKLMSKIERQLKKVKEKRREHRNTKKESRIEETSEED